MQPESDAQLLRDYTTRGTEAAFTELVRRHTNLVYSAALRQVESPDVAAEITQNVFVGLAKSAPTLLPRFAPEASLAGWLCRSARNLCLNYRRDEFRRRTRERHAMDQLATSPESAPDWESLRRVLDDAMAELNETDYDALVLRFFQNQDFRHIGVATGVSDDTAQKRVTRALDKLRDLLARRGIRTTATTLGLVISANAVHTAPVGLALAISSAALTGTTLLTSATTTATQAIAMTALQKTVVAVTIAALAGVGIYEAHQNSQLREQVQILEQQQAPLALEIQQLRHERDDATSRLAALREDNERLARNSGELLRLRGEVGMLRRQADELDRLHKENLKLQQLTAANSQAAVPPAATSVTEIFISRIKQPQTFSDEMIRTNVAVKVGSPYDSAAVDADLRNLYGTGWFRSVRVAKSESTKGITLNYVLREKPKLAEVHFSGNSHFDAESLASLAHSKAGLLLDERMLQADAERIQAAYLKAGFTGTTVKYASKVNEATGEGSVDFNIVE